MKNTVPYTKVEEEYLTANGFTLTSSSSAATDGYSKITKRADNQFIRVLYIEDYDGQGYWDDDHADQFSALDFL